MYLSEMYEKVFTLIEEYDEKKEFLTGDEDYEKKINHVINQISNELARIKKISKRKQITITDITKDNPTKYIHMKDIDSRIYQVNTIKGVKHEIIDSFVMFKDNGKANIFYYTYPERITEDTNADEYEFELEEDLLEIMPYGVAGVLLMNDISNQYGQIFLNKYELLKSQLDPRKSNSSLVFEGGVDI